jgi:hypothetical protein
MKIESKPRIVAMTTLFLLATSIAAFAQGSAGNAPAPRLVIDKLEHNFGEIKKGDPVKHTFIVKNEGKANLEIKNVAPS